MILIYQTPRDSEQEPQQVLRLDKYLSTLKIPELYSRSLIESLIGDGMITVNEVKIKKNYLLKEGDSIEINLPPPPETTLKPENIPLEILYEDDYLAIINKPAGIIVHPTPGNYQGTIVNAALHHFGENLADKVKHRPGIVHRLDKNTSGLMIIAKDNKTLAQLNKSFAERSIEKHYKAILTGIPQEDAGTITTAIGRSNSDRTKMTVRKQGKEAVTSYQVEKTFTYFSFVDVRLETGRTHQIRVHFNHLNCPVLGDDAYGKNKLKCLLPRQYYKRVSFYLERHLKRQALHAYSLRFIHPATGEQIYLEAPLPDDITDCLAWLQEYFG